MNPVPLQVGRGCCSVVGRGLAPAAKDEHPRRGQDPYGILAVRQVLPFTFTYATPPYSGNVVVLA